MRYIIDKCPVCKTDCMAGSYDFEDKKAVDCDRCGKFKVSLWGLDSSKIYEYKNGFAILSYYIRNFHNQEELLDDKKINQILNNYQLPTYEYKSYNLLKWIANEAAFSTKSVTGIPNKLASIIGAVDGQELTNILDDIWGERLIEVEQPTGSSLRQFGPLLGFKVHLTPAGIKKVNEKKEQNDKIYSDTNFEYEVVFSFAGEDRLFVEKIAEYLSNYEVKFFYDRYEESTLWGKNLYEYLDHIYRKSAKFCVMVLSQNYAKKLWTNHERKSAQARAFEQNQEYILPIKLDNTEISGILPTIDYVNGNEKTPQQIAAMILEKLNAHKKNEITSNHNKTITSNDNFSVSFEVNEFLKRVSSNSESLSVIVSDCLFFAKKIQNKELERFCVVELSGIKKGEYYPDFFHRKFEVFAGKEQININFPGWSNDITNAIKMMENYPDMFYITKILAWQPISEIEELIKEKNIEKKLISFKLTALDLDIKTVDPNISLHFYAKAIRYKEIYFSIRHRLTEFLIQIIQKVK